MQRKRIEHEKMSLKSTVTTGEGTQMKPLPNPKVESLLRLALPLYGGTTPVSTVPAATTPPAQPDPAPQATNPPEATQEPNPAGGSDDPIAKLAADPQALGQLLSQVQRLQSDLEKANEKVGQFESEKQEAERKQLTKEQQLEQDIAQRDATIQQMDAVIKNMALAHAMNTVEGVQWNSVKQALAELKPDEFDIKVDLENGTATVDGIKEAAQRIAKDSPWLVKAAVDPKPEPPRRQQPSSGNPPKPPASGEQGKQVQRNRLMKKYPALGGAIR
jgi:hypothetical protein